MRILIKIFLYTYINSIYTYILLHKKNTKKQSKSKTIDIQLHFQMYYNQLIASHIFKSRINLSRSPGLFANTWHSLATKMIIISHRIMISQSKFDSYQIFSRVMAIEPYPAQTYKISLISFGNGFRFCSIATLSFIYS